MDAGANRDTGGNGEEAAAEKAESDAPHEESSAMKSSGLTEAHSHTDAKSDVVMNDGNAYRGDNEEPCQDGFLNSPPSIAIDSTGTPVNVSAADAYTADVLSTTNNTVALGASLSTNRPPAPAASPSQHPSAQASPAISTTSLLPSDESVPAYLAPAILVYLRGVSSARAWQDLVAGFLQFERGSPPCGVSSDITQMC